MNKRPNTYIAVLGAVGLIIGVVALFIGLNAQSQNKSDAEISQEIKSEATRQITAVNAKQNAASEKANKSDKELSGSQAATNKVAKQNAEKIASLENQVAKAQKDATAANTTANTASGDTTSLAQEQDNLKSQVNKLQKEVSKLNNQIN